MKKIAVIVGLVVVIGAGTSWVQPVEHKRK